MDGAGSPPSYTKPVHPTTCTTLRWSRGSAIGGIAAAEVADAPDLWRTLVHLNLLGAGRRYEERVWRRCVTT